MNISIDTKLCLNEKIEDAVNIIVRRNHAKAIQKKKEYEAKHPHVKCVATYNNKPEWHELHHDDRKEIALLWVRFKIWEVSSGQDSAWFYQPLTHENCDDILLSAISNSADINDVLGSKFLFTYEEQLIEYYEKWLQEEVAQDCE